MSYLTAKPGGALLAMLLAVMLGGCGQCIGDPCACDEHSAAGLALGWVLGVLFAVFTARARRADGGGL